MGSDDSAARLADNIGNRNFGSGADFADVEHDIAGVFLHRIVHGALEIGARTVVIDAEAAPDVEESHREPHFCQLAIEACRLDHGVLDRDDIRHLRADVKMH